MPRREAVPAVDITQLPFLRRKALEALGSITRAQALDIACLKCAESESDWVTPLYRAGAIESLCLGRFDLENGYDPQLPWPAIMFLVRGRPGGPGSRMRSCALAVHLSMEQAGVWVVSDGEPVTVSTEGGVLHINGRPFTGEPGGEAGVLNGDGGMVFRPSDPLPAPADQQAPTHSNPAPARGQSRPRTSRRTVRDRNVSARAERPTPSRVDPPAQTRLALAVEFLRLLDRLLGP